LANDVVEEVCGIKRIITEVFKNSSVKLITTRLRDYAYLTARAGTELSRVIAGFNSKLLHIFKTRLQAKWRRHFTV
jgi:hypothetical protein